MPRFALLASAVALVSLSACDTGDGIPRGVEIYQIVVEDAPLFRPDGERWDGGLIPSGPDIYVILLDRGGAILLNTDDEEFNRSGQDDGIGNYTDVSGRDFPLVWDLEPDVYLPGLDRAYEIVVKDDDPTTTDDEIEFTDLFSFDERSVRVNQDADLVVQSASGETTVRIRYRVVD